MCNVLATQHSRGLFPCRGIDAPMLPHSSDDLAVSLSGKDDIFLDSLLLILDRSATSLEFSLSTASPFSPKQRLALCVYS